MAELKQEHYAKGVGRNTEYLHGFTAVAELKRVSGRPVPHGATGDLHGFTAVAELKLAVAALHQPMPDDISTASPPWPN